MRSNSSLVVVLGFVLLCGYVNGDTTASIDCSSGSPDPDSDGESVTAADCSKACTQVCGSVNSADELESCLTNQSIKGCLFDIGSVIKRAADLCSFVTAGKNQTSVKARLLGDDLYSVPDHVKSVLLSVELEDVTLAKSCANKSVKIGVSSEAFDPAKCDTLDTLSTSSEFSVAGSAVVVDMRPVLAALLGGRDDAVVVAQFQDATCALGEIKGQSIYYNMGYQSGYINAAECKEITDCWECKQAGCHFCSWDRFVPSWLPDWDWVQNAKTKTMGKCGLNRALCTVSLGRMDVCGAPARVSQALMTLFVLVFITSLF